MTVVDAPSSLFLAACSSGWLACSWLAGARDRSTRGSRRARRIVPKLALGWRSVAAALVIPLGLPRRCRPLGAARIVWGLGRARFLCGVADVRILKTERPVDSWAHMMRIPGGLFLVSTYVHTQKRFEYVYIYEFIEHICISINIYLLNNSLLMMIKFQLCLNKLSVAIQ